jgi:hypothetical protein
VQHLCAVNTRPFPGAVFTVGVPSRAWGYGIAARVDTNAPPFGTPHPVVASYPPVVA